MNIWSPLSSVGWTERSALQALREQLFVHTSHLIAAFQEFDPNHTGVSESQSQRDRTVWLDRFMMSLSQVWFLSGTGPAPQRVYWSWVCPGEFCGHSSSAAPAVAWWTTSSGSGSSPSPSPTWRSNPTRLSFPQHSQKSFSISFVFSRYRTPASWRPCTRITPTWRQSFES